MRATMIAYTFYETDNRVRRYAEALANTGNDVDVFVLKGKGEKKYDTLNGVNIYRIQKREYNERGLQSYLFRTISFFIKATAILLKKHLTYPYEIIHIHNAPDFLVFTALIPKLLGAKIILDMHENLPELYCAKFNKGSDTILFKLLRFVEKISTKFADHVITAHDLLKERIIVRDKIPHENCTALLNYSGITHFKDPSNISHKDRLRIIYPGTVSEIHGIDIAIRALSTVKKEVPNFKFILYTRSNETNYFKTIKRLINDYDLNNNIEVFDPVRTEELGKILPNATLGIVPKRGGIFGSEAFSSKILDFMTAGVPVIASRTKIEEFYFDDSMIMFFEPENHQTLAQCILEIYNNPEKGKYLEKKKKNFIAKNNWEAKKAVYFQIIDHLIEEKSFI